MQGTLNQTGPPTTTNERRRYHIGRGLRIEGQRAGKNDRRRDQTSKHSERVLQPARHCQDERQLIVDAVEGWLFPSVRCPATDRERQDGKAEPGVVVVAEPAFSGGHLAMDDARVVSDVKPRTWTWRPDGCEWVARD